MRTKMLNKRNKNLSIATGNYGDENLEYDQDKERFNRLVENILDDNSRARTAKQNEYIARNIKIAANWNVETLRRRQTHQQTTKLRILKTKKVRSKIVKLDLKRTKKFINRWDVVRKVNRKKNIEQDRFEKKQHFNDAWVRFYHVRYVLKNLAAKYIAVRDEEIREIRSSWCIRTITKYLRKQLNKRAITLDARIHHTACYSLALLQPFIKDTIIQRTKPVIYDFLDETAK
jgi:hypothetical protein